MIAYYLYGRGKDGYVNYNPYYTKLDEDHYFLKMAGYTGGYEDNQPEKRFYYQIQTQEKGKCSIFGKSTFVKMYSSILSGARDTVFSFQYLISEKERKELLANPALLYEYDCFPDNMDQVHRTMEGGADISLDNAVFDLDYFFANHKKQNTHQDEYSLTELLNTFNIDEQKLRDLIYTLLLFNTEEKVYFILPENTKESTDKAFSLMSKILSILPEIIVSKTGFVTYVNKIETVGADFVPYEIRYMFLANTYENINICKSTRTAYVFCSGCETGVDIPDVMQEMVSRIEESLISGKLDSKVQDLWGALNKYLKTNETLPVSAVEYCAINDYCEIYRTIAIGEKTSSDSNANAIWNNIDILRSMVKQRTELWNDSLKNDLAQYVKKVIDSDYVDENDGYKRIIAEYEADKSLHTCIENYFIRKVNDYDLLEKYLNILDVCPELKKNVYEHSIDMLVDMLDSGELDESMHATVLGIYEEHPELQNKIQVFFEKLIVSEDSFEYVQNLITTPTLRYHANLKLWSQIEKAVYLNAANYSLVLNIEIKRVRQAFSNNTLNIELIFQSFWKHIQTVYGLNRKILYDRNYFAEIKSSSAMLLAEWIEPSTLKRILIEAQNHISRYCLPNEYIELFSNASEKYLESYKNKICLTCDDLELFNNWPLIDKGNIDISQIKRALQCKKLEGDSNAQFEAVIKSGNSISVCCFITSKKNSLIIEQVSKSTSLETYISSILKQLEREVITPGRNNISREYYDELCLQLILKFPKQMNQVFRYVMRSRYGGVWAMSSIYTLVNQKKRTDNLTNDIIYEIKLCMAQEIMIFFDHHKISKDDKKSIKMEKDFLREIGLFYKELLRL